MNEWFWFIATCVFGFENILFGQEKQAVGQTGRASIAEPLSIHTAIHPLFIPLILYSVSEAGLNPSCHL